MKKIYSFKQIMALVCAVICSATSYAQVTFDQLIGQSYISCPSMEASVALGSFQTAAYTYTKVFKTGDKTVNLVDFLGLPAEIPATFDEANQKLIVGVNSASALLSLREDEFDGLVDVFQTRFRTANTSATEIKLSVKMEKDYYENDVVRIYFDEDLSIYRELGMYSTEGAFVKDSEQLLGTVVSGVYLNFSNGEPVTSDVICGNHIFTATETWYMGSKYIDMPKSSTIKISAGSAENKLIVKGLFNKDIAVEAIWNPEFAVLVIPNQAFGSDFLANPVAGNMYLTYNSYSDSFIMSSFMNIQDATSNNAFTYGSASTSRVLDYDIEDIKSKTWKLTAESYNDPSSENLFPKSCTLSIDYTKSDYGDSFILKNFLGIAGWHIDFDPKVSSVSLSYAAYYSVTINDKKYYLAEPGKDTVSSSVIVFTYNKDNNTFTCPGLRIVTSESDAEGNKHLVDHAVYTNLTLAAESSSVETIEGADAKTVAYANNGVIYINGEEEAAIYQLNGTFVAKAKGSASNLAQGIYIVVVGNKAVKVIL